MYEKNNSVTQLSLCPSFFPQGRTFALNRWTYFGDYLVLIYTGKAKCIRNNNKKEMKTCKAKPASYKISITDNIDFKGFNANPSFN